MGMFIVARELGALPNADWSKRHIQAWERPVGYEQALKTLIVGLALYADCPKREFGSRIGDDSMLGPAVKYIAEGILRLLDGNCGRFDQGALDALVRTLAAEHGIELEQ